jgi:hypothetical protein
VSAAVLQRDSQGCGLVKVILTRKLARVLNGIDLTACNEGDVMEMGNQDARLLIAEGWAVPLMEERPIAQDQSRRRIRKSGDDGSRSR